jgi:ATP-dependent DNA ligase
MPLPRVQPIIPILRKEPFDDPDWLFEFKYDGFRALLYIEQRRCRFVSRNRNTMARFDALGDQVAAEPELDDAILDGEVIAADETGRPQFYVLLRRSGRLAYVAFDLLWRNGADLRGLPLRERRTRLQGILPKGSSVISEALSGRAPIWRPHQFLRAYLVRVPYSARPRPYWLIAAFKSSPTALQSAASALRSASFPFSSAL